MDRKADKVSPPTLDVTLVFTDIQGSTALWEKAPAIMRRALSLHDAVLRAGLQDLDGYEVKTAGDAFMAAFADPVKAAAWCLTVQKKLHEAAWPAGLSALPEASDISTPAGETQFRGLRVRMGVHTGRPDCKPDLKSGRMDYFGDMVNRAARVAAAAHGGQVFVSGETWEKIRANISSLGSPVSRDLGEHRLKGLEAVERLVMLLPPGLAKREFPPPRTLDARRTNLQPHPASFVGREAVLESLDGVFREGRRLVTLSGLGGVGKTRLASRYAAIRLEDFSGPGDGGAWFCDLSETATLEDICEAVGRVLRSTPAPGLKREALVEQLGHEIANRNKILLIMDNFEQVIRLAPQTVSKWLALAPKAVFLATSRESLNLRGEAVLDLPPLSVPASGSDISHCEAVQLFLDRAEAARNNFISSSKDLSIAGDIVKRLDGIPLAIELAASRAGIFSALELRDRLAKHLDLLASNYRDAPARQSTLRKTIEWSWQLLKPWEQNAFAQCAVFHGGFTLEAAENILRLSDFPDAPPPLEVVQALKNKSLLYTYEPSECPDRLRFGLYVSVHEFAEEKFRDMDSLAAVTTRHSDYYLELAPSLILKVLGGGGGKHLGRLAVEEENLRSVYRRALTAPVRPDTALKAAVALDPLYTTRGPFIARVENLNAAIACAEAADAARSCPALLAWAYEARGRAYLAEGLPARSESVYEKGLLLARKSADRRVEVFILRNLGLLKSSQGKMADALRYYERALAIVLESGELADEGFILEELGSYFQAIGELNRAADYHARARTINSEVGNQLLEALALLNLGFIQLELQQFAEAEARLLASHTLAQELGDLRIVGYALGYLGCLYLEKEDLNKAREYLAQALRTLKKIGEHDYHNLFYASLGSCEALSENLAEAEKIFQECERRTKGIKSPPLLSAMRLHLAVYQACLADSLAKKGSPGASEAETAARACFDEPISGTESDDARFARRLLGKALNRIAHIR